MKVAPVSRCGPDPFRQLRGSLAIEDVRKTRVTQSAPMMAFKIGELFTVIFTRVLDELTRVLVD